MATGSVRTHKGEYQVYRQALWVDVGEDSPRRLTDPWLNGSLTLHRGGHYSERGIVN